MSEQRKATDILLALEEKVDQLNRYIQNFDNNMKILMNRITSLEQKQPQAVIKPQIPSVSPAEATVKKPQITVSSEDKSKKKKVEGGKNGKINVTQVVVDKNDKRLMWALVEIFNSNGQLIEKTKTNTGGRWMKELLPGEYNIKISKPHPEINLEYKINVVQNDNSLIELETYKYELSDKV